MSLVLNFLAYFFEIMPPPLSFNMTILLFIVSGVILGTGIGLDLYLRRQKENKILKKMFKPLPKNLYALAICLGLYVLVRYERMPYISMRILMFIVLGLLLYFIVKYAKAYIKDYPEIKKERLERLELNKYLPRKKKRK